MSRLYCLNAGKADCFLIELTCEDGIKYILMDGGSRQNPISDVNAWLAKMGIKRIDCMILTHLHQDHLGYLDNVAMSVQVDKAVLPYPPVPLTETELAGLQDEERIEDIKAYNHLWDILTANGCSVETTLPLTASSYRYGKYELRCLFPFPDTVSNVYAMLCRLQREKPERVKAMYDSVRTLFNRDSSIWLLKEEGRPVLLLCGDGVHSSLAAAIGGYGIKVPIIKLSHHGRNDKGNLYYQADFINSLEPEKIIVTSDTDSATVFLEEWNRIRPEAELIVTGRYEEVKVVEL